MIENATKKQLKTLKMIIYLFTNKINGKQYVGKAEGTFFGRYTDGKWWKKPANKYLKNSIKKYGRKNFNISILKFNVENEEILGDLETFYIKDLNTLFPNGYNFCPGGNRYQQNLHIGEISRMVNSKSCRLYNHRTEQIVDIVNVNKFCKENKLNRGTLYEVINGKSKQHKEWTLPDVEIRKWQVTSPDGDIFKIIDGEISEFCRKYGLTHTNFSKMLNKKNRRNHKGWRLSDRPTEEKIFKSPNGDIFTVKYRELTNLCREFDLCPSTMNDVWNDKRLQHKGFRLLKNEDIYFKQFKPITYYYVYDINNVIDTFTDFHEFSNKHNLEVAKLFMLFRKEIQYTDKWFLTDKNVKLFWLKSPNGEVFKILGGKPLGIFCKNNNLRVGNILNVMKGKRKQCNGWTKTEPPIDYQI